MVPIKLGERNYQLASSVGLVRYGVRRLDAVLDRLNSGLTRKPAHSTWGALTAPHLTTETGTRAVESGVEPPYSIRGLSDR